MPRETTPPIINPAPGTAAARLSQLQHDGFCVLESVVKESVLEKIRVSANRAIAAQTDEQLAKTRSPGTLIDSNNYPELADLIGNPKALHELKCMGLSDIKFWKAVIISKPPNGPRLYWHQDCMMWQDPRAYSDVPPMLFLMYYLEDTTQQNGCLRVIPCSHRHRLDLHDLGAAHAKEINRIEDPNDPRFLDYPGEIDVPVTAGDVVVGDARMLHAAHANQSNRRRTVITIWFHPYFSDLQEQTQSFYHDEMHRRHAGWPADALKTIDSLVPRYAGSAAPMKVQRIPDTRLT